MYTPVGQLLSSIAPPARGRSSWLSAVRSQEKPRTAKYSPKAPHSPITASASRLSDRRAPVTIAPERPSISGFSGSASAMLRRKPGALLESNT